MTNNELLLSISDLMDEKLKPMAEDIKVMKEDIKVMKGDIKLLQDNQKTMAESLHRLHIEHENDIIPRLKLMESAYLSTYKRYESSNEQIDRMQLDVDVLKITVAEHSEVLKKIS